MINPGAPMNSLLDVDQLRTFLAIVETGSFTRAAEIVHKTQSAVSMQMKRLEERVGRPVFARDGRASKLTEDGERLLDFARRIVKLNVEALAAFADFALSGRVRLGVPDDYADRYLPEIMARFSRAYPGVELSVVCEPSTDLIERIGANELDLAIITDCESTRPVESFRRERLLWVASNRHTIHREEPLPLALGRPACRWRQAAIEGLEAMGRPAWSGGRIACSLRVATLGRSRRRCSPGSRYRCFRNRGCAPVCACSAPRKGFPSSPRAESACCATPTGNRRSPTHSPATSSRRSTTCPRRARRPSSRVSEIRSQRSEVGKSG